ncbi:uncharacterized protein K441DRAFT_585922, partial [Cenococcum geophilum 1.58]|uniref:uncharacterized protein n=1 Tax=Cenococcum geophilum 1.58 TaxID=794803 RepID=UPI00358DED39
TLEGYTNYINTVAFSLDSKLIISALRNRTMRLIALALGDSTMRTLKGYTHWINAVAFLPDSKLIILASVDRTVWV